MTIVSNCPLLKEFSVERLRGTHDGTEMIDLVLAASSLKSTCLKELVNGQSSAPLIIGSKKNSLRTLKGFGKFAVLDKSCCRSYR
ncbi:hypothetical protein K1719_042014 [Acacia pycnantha]|nr:hypothetical protein K1719_042014 [Acacia pycnantha]